MPRIANVSNIWFGRSDLPKRDLDTMADGLRRAVRSADVLGVPTRSRLSRFPVCRMVFDDIVAVSVAGAIIRRMPRKSFG
jgi:hypothetical protein